MAGLIGAIGELAGLGAEEVQAASLGAAIAGQIDRQWLPTPSEAATALRNAIFSASGHGPPAFGGDPFAAGHSPSRLPLPPSQPKVLPPSMPKKQPQKRRPPAKAAWARKAARPRRQRTIPLGVTGRMDGAVPMRGLSQTIKGRITYATAVSEESPNRVLNYKFNYAEVEGTRPGRIMALYEKYFVKRLAWHYCPTVAATQAGAVHMVPEYDPRDRPPEAADAVSIMSQCAFYRTTRVAVPLTVNMPNARLPDGTYIRPALYTSPLSDSRFTDFGSLMVLVEGTGVQTDMGKIVCDYEIECCVPQMQQFAVEDVPQIVKLRLPAERLFPVRCTEQECAANPVATMIDGSAVAVTRKTTDLLRGFIEDDSNATLTMCDDTALEPGSQIFFTPAAVSAAGAPYSTTEVVGGIWADMMRTIPLAVKGAANAFVALRDVKHIIADALS